MALNLSLDAVSSLGIGSPYRSVEELYIVDPLNASNRVIDVEKTTLSWSDLPVALLNIQQYQDKIGVGCSGWGIDISLLPSLFPTMYWFTAIMLVRFLCREPFARLGIAMGVVTENHACHRRRLAAGKRGMAALSRRNQQKILKFQNQVWLAMFYIISTIFGYVVQRDQPWFRLPLDDESSLHLLLPHPYNPSAVLLMYYHYGLAFYFAELFSLVILERSIKRSDYVEYVFHHFTTLLLMVCSHLGLEHRFGAYVLFLHDASDVMLCVSKSLHYMTQEDDARQLRYNRKQMNRDGSHGTTAKRYRRSFLFGRLLTENTVNACFAVFIAIFFFLRLFCLPMMAKATVRMASRVRHGNFNMWMLVVLLNVVLQSLHIYWGMLIILLVANLLRGGERKDIRSDEDIDDEVPSCVHWGFLAESEEEEVTGNGSMASRQASDAPLAAVVEPRSHAKGKMMAKNGDDESAETSKIRGDITNLRRRK